VKASLCKGGSRLFSDFARITIFAAGEQDLEGRFSLRNKPWIVGSKSRANERAFLAQQFNVVALEVSEKSKRWLQKRLVQAI
jgi:hypothetical protein